MTLARQGEVAKAYKDAFGTGTYYAVEDGETFSLILTNDAPFRRLAVVTVDGLNVLSGEQGVPQGPGFVLRAWERVEVRGWYVNDTTTKPFRCKLGSNPNQGAVGIALYSEHWDVKVPAPSGPHTSPAHYWPHPIYEHPPNKNKTTCFTQSTAFRKHHHEPWVNSFLYGPRTRLQEWGVVFTDAPRSPNPFPHRNQEKAHAG